MTVRRRLALVTGLTVLVALGAFELVFYVEILLDPAQDKDVVFERLPRALVVGGGAALSAAALAAWLGREPPLGWRLLLRMPARRAFLG